MMSMQYASSMAKTHHGNCCHLCHKHVPPNASRVSSPCDPTAAAFVLPHVEDVNARCPPSMMSARRSWHPATALIPLRLFRAGMRSGPEAITQLPAMLPGSDGTLLELHNVAAGTFEGQKVLAISKQSSLVNAHKNLQHVALITDVANTPCYD